MNTHLVVGWDGSASARRALEWALDQDSDGLLLVQVVKEGSPFGGLEPGDDPRADGAVSVETAAADAQRSHPGVEIDTRVVTGDPVESLARFAGPDCLVVVGDRRRTVLRFRAGWSIGARLVRTAPGPVAVIAEDGSVGGSGVVVGIDDSIGSDRALTFAADWATRSGQRLYVVHAWHASFLWHDRGAPPEAYLAELRAQHAEVLVDAVARVTRSHPDLEVLPVTVEGTAARGLSDFATGCALLVIGSNGATRVQRMLLSSVSQDILLNLSIPTVIIGRRSTPIPAVAHDPDGEIDVSTTDAAPAASRTSVARTVVAWDGRSSSRSAIEWAVDREKRSGGRVDVMIIADEAAAEPASAAATETVLLDERAAVRLEEELRASAPGVVVEAEVVRGFVLQTLAELTRPDALLVVGTEDRDGPRMRFGLSIGARLPALAGGPVAIIPHTVDGSLSGIAVGVDGSSSSNAAVLVAAEEAVRRSAILHIVHAWEQPTIYESTFLLDAEFITALESEHRRILDEAELLASTNHPSLRVETHLLYGSPARALADLRPRAAVVVVGSRGLTGWRRILLGSVSHELILNLDVPLIVVARSEPLHAPSKPESPAEASGMQEELFV